MTVNVTSAFDGPFVPNGATTAFPFTFATGSASEIKVLIDGAEVSAGLYTVALNDPAAAIHEGGTVTFSAAPTGSALVIASDPDFAQDIAFTDAGPFLASTNDEVNDRSVIRDIYLRQLIADTLDVAITLTGAISAATRTALGLLPGALGTVLLSEAGREGLFVWSAANLSAQVTADPNQGIYVAPASAPTGASGAWVRKFSGAHNVKWFGATGDGTTNDSAAVLAALAYLGATAQGGFGYSASAAELFFPKGHYYLNASTIELTYTTILTGEGTGQAGGAASLLRWAAGTTGIRTQRANTTGATAIQASSGHGGDGSIIRGLYLKGGFTTAEGEFHGIQLRATATIEDCFIELFQGDAVYVKATIGGGVGSEGACNCFQINRVFTQFCRNGLYTEGADANAANIVSFSAIACRQFGILEKSFLGNSYVAPHVASNARNAINNGTTLACSFVTQGGNRYTVIRGQEAGASTNAPTGAATNNTWWIYVEAGGVTTGCPAWFNGIVVRAGGGYLTEGVSNATALFHPYGEIDQYSQFDQNAGIFGNGFLQGHIKVSGGVASANRSASMGASLNGFRFLGNLQVNGDANLKSQSNFIGVSTGAAADSLLTLDCSNALSDIVGNVGGVEKGRVRFSGAINGTDILGNALVRLRIAGADVASVDSTGMLLAAGKNLYVNAIKVVGAQGAAVADPAAITSSAASVAVAAPTKAEFDALVGKFNQLLTDFTSVRTQNVALLARLRAATGHGLIA